MTEPVRRLRAVDEIDRLHTLAEKLAERRQPVGVTPSFKIAQVKAVGGAVVHEWEVHVPVCDEYPTVSEAFGALRAFAIDLARAYPPPTTTNGGREVMTVTVNCEEYEYTADPTDGVTLSDGKAWWGTAVKYRKIGTRNWKKFTLVDSHSWDEEAIVAAIDYQVTP